MVYEIKDKVALVTGGASGLGLAYSKELLKSGVRGLTIADVNEELGKKVLQEFEAEFGQNRTIFVKTDVTNKGSYEDAFKRTIETFNNIDILVNNAGILNENTPEKLIAVNLTGMYYGTILALENYIQKHKSGEEGVIVNVSSTGGVVPAAFMPVYSGTKFGIYGMSKAYADEAHYKRTNVRIVILCPGPVETALVDDLDNKLPGPGYVQILRQIEKIAKYQKPEFVAQSLVRVIQEAKPGTAWVVERGEEPYEFPLVSRDAYRNNTLDKASGKS